MRRILRLLGTSAAVLTLASGGSTGAKEPPDGGAKRGPRPLAYAKADRAGYLSLAGDVEKALREDVLAVWFPRSVDVAHGGFSSDFSRDWQPVASGGKFSVFQGRMTWVAAQVVMRRPDLQEQFLPYVRHGVRFLRDVLWDKEHGGFYWGLGDDGSIDPSFTDGKHLYGIAFCIYGLAAAYKATGDKEALDLAMRGFRWIEQNAHDARNGGYDEWLSRDGEREGSHPDGKETANPFHSGFKSMNTHIHLLEAFAQLYEVSKDETLRARLEELLLIVRDKIASEPGVMSLYFTPDWKAVPDHDSYGHDIESGYLMLEAEDALGVAHDPRTERMARMFVDHALAHGWDEALGGFFRDGTTFGPAEDKQKEWWVQFEGLNALLLMHERHGRESEVYFKAFQRQWQFIKDYQCDTEFHGYYEMLGPEGGPSTPGKGRIWKAAYHDGRALMNVSEKLRHLAGEAAE